MAEEQAALLARIKALSGAIDQRRTGASLHRGGHSRPLGGVGGRGGSQRGGYASHQPLPSRHRSLVIGKAGNGGSSGDVPGEQDQSGQPSNSRDVQEGWVKRKSTHNMSLVSSSTFEKTEPARLAAITAKQKAIVEGHKSAGRNVKGKASASVRRGDNMGEVIIDGVTFEFDETGTKLVKKQSASVARAETQTDKDTEVEAKQSTPLRTSVNGQDFVRTKTGNMISQAVLDQRQENRLNSAKLKRMGEIGKEIAERQRLRNQGRQQAAAAASASKSRKAKTLCAYYNKTGQCKNGLRCPYKHDPDRVAICPRFLRPAGCPLPMGTCPLSHNSTPERVPHCVHFLATAGACRNGDACRYTHPVQTDLLTNESPICMAFSDFGWCSNGRSCNKRHTWDCPEFLRKGKCERRGCRLMHVVRAAPNAANGDEDRASRAKQLDDDELFLRDDDAYVHPGSEHEEESDLDIQEEPEEEETVNKRKRPLESLQEEEEDESKQPLSFKARKTKDFQEQNDFISFNDDDFEAEESEGEAETTSVHSDSDEERAD